MGKSTFEHPDEQAVMAWLEANGVAEWLPEHPVIEVWNGANEIRYSSFVWDGPRGYDSENIALHGPMGHQYLPIEQRIVPLVVPADENIERILNDRYSTAAKHLAEVNSTGLLKRAIHVYASDGIRYQVGHIEVPVTIECEPPTGVDARQVTARVVPGAPVVKIAVGEHEGCSGDLALHAVIDSGNGRIEHGRGVNETIEIGKLFCCSDCEPRLTRRTANAAA